MPSEGRITIEGRLVGRETRTPGVMAYGTRELNALRCVGMVFQQFNLFPHMTVEGNVMIGLMKLRGMTEEAARTLAHDNLRRVGILRRRGRSGAPVRRPAASPSPARSRWNRR